jgi:UDP-N-acetylglucosamine transferase subunit ALG13
MIFVTIGSQLPFDRLIQAIDEIAPTLGMPVVAQVFESKYTARNIKTLDFVTPSEFSGYIRDADLVIAHAGMGTILSAMELNKPILVVPRKAKYHEARNDHQISNAEIFEKLKYVYVAYEVDDLKKKVPALLKDLKPLYKIDGNGSSGLITSLRSFIEGKEEPVNQ